MIKYSFDESELTSEKSLWDVYKQSRKILPSKLQFFTVLGSMLILGAGREREHIVKLTSIQPALNPIPFPD
ncbi:hypothetical protein ACK36U_16925, partial [Aeromonas veronii]